jgi:hypothetical protein
VATSAERVVSGSLSAVVRRSPYCLGRDRLERRLFGAGQSEMTYGLGTQDGVIWIGWALGLRAETKATGLTGTRDSCS